MGKDAGEREELSNTVGSWGLSFEINPGAELAKDFKEHRCRSLYQVVCHQLYDHTY